MKHRIQVRPEDLYNEQTILAAQEGRLFIDLKTDTIDRETINNNERAYVHRIDSLVTRRFSASIDALWDAIFRHDGLMSVLALRHEGTGKPASAKDTLQFQTVTRFRIFVKIQRFTTGSLAAY